MDRKRVLSTSFWKDNYISELDPSEKLVFLYLLTNHRTNIAGIYEYSLKETCFDTGFNGDMVTKITDRFVKDGKIAFCDGYIILINWLKHQAKNPSVEAGISRILSTLPLTISKFYENYTHQKSLISRVVADTSDNRLNLEDNTSQEQPEDSLSTGGSTKLNLTKPNANRDSPAYPAGPGDEFLDDSEPAKKTKSVTVRVSSVEIDKAFDYWQETVGYRVTSNLKSNREYCGKLIREYGSEALYRMIQGVAMAAEDKFAPRVADFRQLYKKWDELKLWGKKAMTAGKKKVVSV